MEPTLPKTRLDPVSLCSECKNNYVDFRTFAIEKQNPEYLKMSGSC